MNGQVGMFSVRIVYNLEKKSHYAKCKKIAMCDWREPHFAVIRYQKWKQCNHQVPLIVVQHSWNCKDWQFGSVTELAQSIIVKICNLFFKSRICSSTLLPELKSAQYHLGHHHSRNVTFPSIETLQSTNFQFNYVAQNHFAAILLDIVHPLKMN